LHDFEKVPVLGRNLPIFTKEEVKIFLKNLGFQNVNIITEEEETVLKESKKLTREKEKLFKKEFNIKSNRKRNVIEEIKQKVSIEEILEENSSYFEVIYDHGDRLDCLCPFNPENNPSFSIYNQPDGSQIAVHYHDCGLEIDKLPYAKHTPEGHLVLDVIDIYMLITGKSFKEALKDLAKKADIQLEDTDPKNFNIPIYRSYDSKQFYLVDDKKKEIYVGNKDHARLWYIDYASEFGLDSKKFTNFIPSIKKVEIRFLPKYSFGKVPDKDIINAFHRSYYMELYEKTEKTLSINDVSFDCFEKELT